MMKNYNLDMEPPRCRRTYKAVEGEEKAEKLSKYDRYEEWRPGTLNQYHVDSHIFSFLRKLLHGGKWITANCNFMGLRSACHSEWHSSNQQILDNTLAYSHSHLSVACKTLLCKYIMYIWSSLSHIYVHSLFVCSKSNCESLSAWVTFSTWRIQKKSYQCKTVHVHSCLLGLTSV